MIYLFLSILANYVSLPGVGDNEQPTILEVLNRGIVNTDDENQTATGSEQPTKEDRSSCDIVNTIKVTSTLEAELERPRSEDKERDNLVSRSSGSEEQAEWNQPQRSQLIVDDGHVLDFESHLIETVNNFSVSEDSEVCGVDIKELPPAEGETIHRTSKIDTDPLGTVIEVEPATPKIFQSIETSVTEPERQCGQAEIEQFDAEIRGSNETEQTTDLDAQSDLTQDSGVEDYQIGDSNLQSDFEGNSVEPDFEIESLTSSGSSNKSQINRQFNADPTDTVDGLVHTRVDIKQGVDQTESLDQVDVEIKSTTQRLEPVVDQVEAVQQVKVEISKVIDQVEPIEKRNVEIKDQVGPTDQIDVKLKPCLKRMPSGEHTKASVQNQVEPKVKIEQSADQKRPIDHIKVDIEPSLQRAEPVEQIEANVKRVDLLEPVEKSEVKVEESVDHVASDDLIREKKHSAQSNEDIHDRREKSNNTKIDIDLSVVNAQFNEDTNSVPKSPQNPTSEDVIIKLIHDTIEEPEPEAIIAQLNVSIKPVAETNKDTFEKSTNEEPKTESLLKDPEQSTAGEKNSASLTHEIDEKLSELTTHLTTSSKISLSGEEQTSSEPALDINGLPLPQTALEEEQRQAFLDSLPQISPETDSNKVAALAKREYYQSLRQYLITHSDKPPVPPETYRWEDLKRAKNRGGYPWTHLYKRPLGPEEEPEIVLLLRKSQELRFASESPKSNKKVRIDDQVSIKETERYIQELSDIEDNPTTDDERDEQEEEEQEDARSECISCVSDSVLTVEKRASKLGKIRGILKKRSPKKEIDTKSLPDTSTGASTSALTLNHKSEEDIRRRTIRPIKPEHNKAKCFPIMKKLRSMADRQKKNFQNIKKISLKKDEKIPLEEEQKIIKLKTSPKAERSEIPKFIEKQDSDDVLEIVELDESPSRKRKDHLELLEQAASTESESTVLVPDEIIEIPETIPELTSGREETPEPTVSEILEEELKSDPVFVEPPPKKTARLRREHVYEDIEDATDDVVTDELNNILEVATVQPLKQSLSEQDSSTLKDVEATKTAMPLERMGSSEEEIERSRLAPISSIDSASSEEERKPPLPSLVEESDDSVTTEKPEGVKLEAVLEVESEIADDVAKDTSKHIPWDDIELKPALKKEASPSPSDKKVTFSHVEDEAEPHREDIELPEGLSGLGPKRWSNISYKQQLQIRILGGPLDYHDSRALLLQFKKGLLI